MHVGVEAWAAVACQQEHGRDVSNLMHVQELSWDVDDGEEEDAAATPATAVAECSPATTAHVPEPSSELLPTPEPEHEPEQVVESTAEPGSMANAEHAEANDALADASAANRTEMAATATATHESAMQQEAEDQTVSSETSRSSSDWTMVSESTARAASVVSLQTEDDSLGNESAVEVREGEEGDVDEVGPTITSLAA